MSTETLLDLAQGLVASLQGTPGPSLTRAQELVALLSGPASDALYETYMTPAGSAEFVSAMSQHREVDFSYIALGDGGGNVVTPFDGITGLVNEVHRVPISSISPHPDNPSWLVIEAVLPVDVGGFTIREVAAIGGPNDSITMSVGNFPTTYKPRLDQNSGVDMIIEMIVYVGNAAIVRLSVDPSVVTATNQSIINAIKAHTDAISPHPQYALVSDFVQHLMALDPHPMYAKEGEFSTHALDPHAHGHFLTADDLAAALAAAAPNKADVHFRTTL